MEFIPRPTFSELDDMIFAIHAEWKDKIRQLAAEGRQDECLQEIIWNWDFMSRLRNVDHKIYFDEEINDIIAGFNTRRFDTSHLLKDKKTFRICFVMREFVDTGAASIPHRYMLENPAFDGLVFEHYFVLTNIIPRGYADSARFRYLRESIPIKEMLIMEPGGPWIEKGRQLEEWIHHHQIDFVVIEPEPMSMFAVASRPALVHGVLNQDCYTYTVGPGCTDLTFLVTTDQVFKYRFRNPDAEKSLKIVMLPLPAQDIVDAAQPLDKADFGLPADAVVSANTNMWKSCFGDSEVLLEGLAAVMRRHPNYHHLFLGTPRCLENVEYFLSRNPDVRGNFHYAGIFKDVYSVLKMIDFFVNSFPTTGGSDIESAIVGKPTVALVANRNLNLHPVEFLRSRECDAVSLEEFVAMIERLIVDPAYRDDLGRYLQGKIRREFDKDDLLKRKLYGAFLDSYRARLEAHPPLPGLRIADTIEYEKMMTLYVHYVRPHWEPERRWEWLKRYCSLFPERPFAWIKLFEEAINAGNRQRFAELVAALPQALLLDPRLHTMIATGHAHFGAADKAVAAAREALAHIALEGRIARRVAARLILAAGDAVGAATALDGHPGLAETPMAGNVAGLLATLPPDSLPLYYAY